MIFFIGAAVNAISIRYLSLEQWIIFKPFLALAISVSMVTMIYQKNNKNTSKMQ
jgi:intracellular septation protein A